MTVYEENLHLSAANMRLTDENRKLRAALKELVQANKDLGQGDIVETITLRDGAWDKIVAFALLDRQKAEIARLQEQLKTAWAERDQYLQSNRILTDMIARLQDENRKMNTTLAADAIEIFKLCAALEEIAKSEPLINGDAWLMRGIARKALAEQEVKRLGLEIGAIAGALGAKETK